ncbi:RNA polymerase sigma factor [Streptosporangium roseum]|uniref:RNA polymerase sigma factor n=1 Tax=Streptosporangium roseum TaxID=2001 RepID=UPI00332D589C
MTATETGRTLARRFREGDETALAELYAAYSAPLHATALRLLGDRELAAEAVQRTLVRAWRAAPEFDEDRKPLPWLYAIVRRAALDVHRDARRAAGGQVALDEAAHLVVEPPCLEREWLGLQVRQALALLHPDERGVLRMAYYDDMTQAEIALVLGLPLGTVKSRTARAQRRIADLLRHVAEPV